jgi:hypothetical protein
MPDLIARYLPLSIDYPTYEAQVHQLVAEERTSGPQQTEALAAYTKLNAQRMRRLRKTTRLTPALTEALAQVKRPQLWLGLTEAWCGDAAQNLPVLFAMSEATPQVELRLLYRDEHPELMDQFLTEGARSIPKLIALDRESGELLGTWGPRPAPVQDQVIAYKAAPHAPYEVFVQEVQHWYNQDKTQALQSEMVALLAQWAQLPDLPG